jgi:hypothetical protein
MAPRLAVQQLAAVEGQGAVLTLDRAGPPTVRAGLLRSQPLGLLLEQDAEGAFADAGGGGAGHVLHRLEIDFRARSGVAEGAAGDDFAPLRGKVPDDLEFLGRELATRHSLSCLVLARRMGDVFLLLL